MHTVTQINKWLYNQQQKRFPLSFSRMTHVFDLTRGAQGH